MDRDQSESGVAIFYILLAVILFAALGFAFMNTANTSSQNLSSEEARVYAQDVLSYANRLSRGVQRTLSRGSCSENDVSFYLSTNTFLASYQHTPEVDDTCKVFHENGGSITWLTAPEGVNDGSDWIFTGNNRIRDIGSYTHGVGNELIAMLPYVNEKVCEEINLLMKIINSGEDIPEDSDDMSTVLFTGEYSNTISRAIYRSDDLLLGKTTACFKADEIDRTPTTEDIYYFYHVLIAR